MRFSIIVPAAPGRREITQTFKADSEAHAREIIKFWLGLEASRAAIVRPITETLHEVVNRKLGDIQQ